MKFSENLKTDFNLEIKNKMSKHKTKIGYASSSNPTYPVNLWIDLITAADYSYYKYFEKFSNSYHIQVIIIINITIIIIIFIFIYYFLFLEKGVSTVSQITHFVETYMAHVVNGVKIEPIFFEKNKFKFLLKKSLIDIQNIKNENE